jgi:hypothetical protein
MQQQSNEQNKFLIDADIGDDDVTLPSLPVVNVPIVETKEQTVVRTCPILCNKAIPCSPKCTVMPIVLGASVIAGESLIFIM